MLRHRHRLRGDAPDDFSVENPADILHARAGATRALAWLLLASGSVSLAVGGISIMNITFYRGAAAVMAGDLASTPASGIRVQACGDAHLLNFGGFATPGRRLVFDINDFDETAPAPWEWDVKRLVASFVLAARANGLGRSRRRDLLRPRLPLTHARILDDGRA